MAEGAVVVEPLDPDQSQPASIDLTLGEHFLKVDENAVDRITLDTELRYIEMHTKGDRDPPALVPARRHPRADQAARQHNRVRRGAQLDRPPSDCSSRMPAGWIPASTAPSRWSCFNANRLPIRLRAGRRICQIVFAQLDRSTERPYRGKYQHQSGAVGSRIHLDRPAPATV